MANNNTWTNYGRNIYLLKRIRIIGIIFFSFLIIFLTIFITLRINNSANNERRELIRVWSEGEYERAYEISNSLLNEKPTDYFLLTINGFSAYQLGISQINNHNMLFFINECIFSLRKALIHNKRDAQIYYVLGKAYWYKGAQYADLAVKYLEIANNMSYIAADIPEYLGLAYAAYGDYRNSIDAFSRALIPGLTPSHNLLLPIARSYIAMEEYPMAISYLQHCIATSLDSSSVIVSRFMLAEIHRTLNDYEKAEKEYLSILEEAGESAEVHFQLGELYNLQGDTTRARSQWRTAFRQDPLHARARARLNI